MPVPDVGTGCSGWAEIDVQLSALGHILNLAYKTPEVYLTVQDETSVNRYRFVPDIGRGGFLLSPVITNVKDLAALARGQFEKLEERMIRHFAIEVPDDPGLMFFVDDFDVQFYCLRFEE